jgi:hypothetical protein
MTGITVVVSILERNGIGFVVVGGEALENSFPAFSDDVDVMVAPSDFERAVRGLRREPSVSYLRMSDDVSRFRVRTDSGQIILDLIDPRGLSGRRSPGAFYEFLESEGSFEKGGVRYARVSVAVYCRLMAPKWASIYIHKVATDVGNGLAISDLNGALDVAELFGEGPRIRERLAAVQREIQLRGLDRPVRWSPEQAVRRE